MQLTATTEKLSLKMIDSTGKVVETLEIPAPKKKKKWILF